MGGTPIHVYHEQAAEIVAAAGDVDRELVAVTDEADLADAQIVVAPEPPTTWRAARQLRLVHGVGAGVEALIESDLPREIPLCSASGVLAQEVAEYAIAMLLALVRGVPTLVERQARREWRPFASATLAGKTLVVLGGGHIGGRVAHIAEALGMNVVVVRRSGTVTLDEALPRAEALVVALPLTKETRNLLDRSALEKLPRGALLVHVARGGIVDESGLRDALDEGRLGGAAIDVFTQEPLPPEHPLWGAPNTMITPHLAGLGLRHLARVWQRILENARRSDAHLPLLGVVDRDAGY